MQQIDLREPENFIPMHKTAEECLPNWLKALRGSNRRVIGLCITTFCASELPQWSFNWSRKPIHIQTRVSRSSQPYSKHLNNAYSGRQ